MKKLRLAIHLVFFAVGALMYGFSFGQSAVPAIPVSTGGPNGTYHKFMTQAAGICEGIIKIVPTVSLGGTPMTLDRLENNEMPAGIVQMDVLELYRQTRDVSNIRVLLPLFSEQVHLVTRSDLGKKEGGGVKLPWTDVRIGSFGAKDVVLNTVNDLVGRKVAASGGSYYTAQVMAYPSLGAVAMQLEKELPSSDDVIKGVLTGAYDAGILVGGQPLPILANMKESLSTLKLLPITDDVASRLSKVYTRGQPLTYRLMGQNGTNIPTLHVKAALVVNNYTTGPMIDAFTKLRNCLVDYAPIQASTPGTHPAWREIKADAPSNWPVWQPPTTAVKPTPANKK